MTSSNYPVDSLSMASDTDSGYDKKPRAAVLFTRHSERPVHSYGAHEAGYEAWKFVSKFVERVCMESELSDEQRQSLLNNLAEVISYETCMSK